MPCPENPEDCCGPPGGGGAFVRAGLLVVNGPDDLLALNVFQHLFIPWRTPAWEAADPVRAFFRNGRAWINARTSYQSGDGQGYEKWLWVAKNGHEAQQYIQHAAEFQVVLARHIDAAKTAFLNETGLPEFPTYKGGGLFERSSESAGLLHVWNYPWTCLSVQVLRDDPLTIHINYSSVPGWKRVAEPSEAKNTQDVKDFLKLRDIWAPLFAKANADADAEYPSPYKYHP